MAIGGRLKALREERGLTQVELGRKVFVSQVYIHQIEVGVKIPSVELMGRLADMFGVSVDTLMGRE